MDSSLEIKINMITTTPLPHCNHPIAFPLSCTLIDIFLYIFTANLYYYNSLFVRIDGTKEMCHMLLDTACMVQGLLSRGKKHYDNFLVEKHTLLMDFKVMKINVSCSK